MALLMRYKSKLHAAVDKLRELDRKSKMAETNQADTLMKSTQNEYGNDVSQLRKVVQLSESNLFIFRGTRNRLISVTKLATVSLL